MSLVLSISLYRRISIIYKLCLLEILGNWINLLVYTEKFNLVQICEIRRRRKGWHLCLNWMHKFENLEIYLFSTHILSLKTWKLGQKIYLFNSFYATFVGSKITVLLLIWFLNKQAQLIESTKKIRDENAKSQKVRSWHEIALAIYAHQLPWSF